MNSHYGILGPALVPVSRHLFRLLKDEKYRSLHRLYRQLHGFPEKTPGQIMGGGVLIHYVDAPSLVSTWGMIMTQRIYDIGEMDHEPFLLDCGANIGLAQLFWKDRYRGFDGIAWEPDPVIAQVLQQNVSSWGIVSQLRRLALSDQETTSSFSSTGNDTGHFSGGETTIDPTCIRVQTERLGQFLSRPVDLLKMDIEGAEYRVLDDVREQLGNVRNIFVEFHIRDRTDRLSNLLAILEASGFVCSVEDRIPHWRTTPFSKLSERAGKYMHCGHIYGKRI